MNITLPDGSKQKLPKGSTGLELAQQIGPGLAKSAVAINIDGIQKDLNDRIEHDCSVSIITIDSDEGLEIMRHTLAAQVLAAAIKNLFPNSKLAIGPTIDNGFYYDVLSDKTISSEDLSAIEVEMQSLIASKSLINKSMHSKKEAVNFFEKKKTSAEWIYFNRVIGSCSGNWNNCFCGCCFLFGLCNIYQNENCRKFYVPAYVGSN